MMCSSYPFLCKYQSIVVNLVFQDSSSNSLMKAKLNLEPIIFISTVCYKTNNLKGIITFLLEVCIARAGSAKLADRTKPNFLAGRADRK